MGDRWDGRLPRWWVGCCPDIEMRFDGGWSGVGRLRLSFWCILRMVFV